MPDAISFSQDCIACVCVPQTCIRPPRGQHVLHAYHTLLALHGLHAHHVLRAEIGRAKLIKEEIGRAKYLPAPECVFAEVGLKEVLCSLIRVGSRTVLLQHELLPPMAPVGLSQPVHLGDENGLLVIKASPQIFVGHVTGHPNIPLADSDALLLSLSRVLQVTVDGLVVPEHGQNALLVDTRTSTRSRRGLDLDAALVLFVIAQGAVDTTSKAELSAECTIVHAAPSRPRKDRGSAWPHVGAS